jgi:hypothetical protein
LTSFPNAGAVFVLRNIARVFDRKELLEILETAARDAEGWLRGLHNSQNH